MRSLLMPIIVGWLATGGFIAGISYETFDYVGNPLNCLNFSPCAPSTTTIPGLSFSVTLNCSPCADGQYSLPAGINNAFFVTLTDNNITSWDISLGLPFVDYTCSINTFVPYQGGGGPCGYTGQRDQIGAVLVGYAFNDTPGTWTLEAAPGPIPGAGLLVRRSWNCRPGIRGLEAAAYALRPATPARVISGTLGYPRRFVGWKFFWGQSERGGLAPFWRQ
jgi:hypothetical protein